MIKLKNVSKFYYNKGLITSGFSRINVEFNLGEFVAITGESGSGKSTLLNVLSGLDSYEEGEMYINNEETSHYTEEDYENYRKKYISNIFQNFNLVNSYTVYQNIELILLISGYKKREIKQKVLELIKTVDLYKYRNQKVSKLSGGQKQRVAIARALAQNTPVIIADEPTGNLDKKSAESVLKTLKKVSENKLVIVVTHNYEYVEQYATRKITMSDGKIIEDKVIIETKENNITRLNEYKKMPLTNKLRLGIRNSFNIPVKLLLLLTIFCFMFIAIITEVSSFKRTKQDELLEGYNSYLRDTNNSRIILNKKDHSKFDENDFSLIGEIPNIEYIVKNDFEFENEVDINNGDVYLFGNLNNIDLYDGAVKYGRMPENDKEVIMSISSDSYYLKQKDNILEKEFNIYSSLTYEDGNLEKIKIVGIAIDEKNEYNAKFYGNKNLINKICILYTKGQSVTNIKANGKTVYANIIELESVPVGKFFATANIVNNIFDTYSSNKTINVKLENLYYSANLDLTLNKTLNKYNYKNITGDQYNEYLSNIYINPQDYKFLYKDDIYQTSIIVKDINKINETINKLEELNYNVYPVMNMLQNFDSDFIYFLNIMNIIITIILLIVMFFISYLIIKLILKSRQTYFTILRILGTTKKVSNQLLQLELLSIFNLSFLIIMGFITCINKNIIKLKELNNMLSLMSIKDYILVYIVILIMTYLISIRFSRYIFKKSTMKTLNEEAL